MLQVVEVGADCIIVMLEDLDWLDREDDLRFFRKEMID